MKRFLKYSILRNVLKLFWIFPITKNKIFLSSYEGKQYSCNPKYIFEELERIPEELLFVWEYNPNIVPEELQKKYVTIVKHNSLSYIYHILTSGIIITNSGITGLLPIRKDQVTINTWHGGGAYKKVGVSYDVQTSKEWVKNLELIANNTEYFISSSKKFTEIMSESTLVPKHRFLEFGMPRNDIFFKENNELKARTKAKLNIDMEEKIILYAPTYRGDLDSSNVNEITFNLDLVKHACESRFGGNWIGLYRGHYYNGEASIPGFQGVNEYPDMQELLLISDILITDYSSSIWDFSFSGKPSFLFTPDKDEYLKNRGVYTSIETWPSILCLNEDMLIDEIIKFDSGSYRAKVAEHLKNLDSYENGLATKRTCELIVSKLKDGEKYE